MILLLAEYPWQVVGTDLFEIDGVHYLLTVDCFSRYLKWYSWLALCLLQWSENFSHFFLTWNTRLFEVIMVPNIHHRNLCKFANSYEFNHITSSPDFLKSNGQVEGIGLTVKRLLKRSNDPYLALLSYCATPLPRCDLSPTQLSMGRRIRTPIPQTNKLLVLNWAYLKTFCE